MFICAPEKSHYFFSLRICQILKAAQHTIAATRINPINRESIRCLTSLLPENLQMSPLLCNRQLCRTHGADILETAERCFGIMSGDSSLARSVSRLSYRR